MSLPNIEMEGDEGMTPVFVVFLVLCSFCSFPSNEDRAGVPVLLSYSSPA
jgi:hypothetical protein